MVTSDDHGFVSRDFEAHAKDRRRNDSFEHGLEDSVAFSDIAHVELDGLAFGADIELDEVIDGRGCEEVSWQLECAIRRPQATLIGALVGGLVPWFARTLAHQEVPAAWSAGNHGLAMVMIAVVLGCACFSALTVYKFGRATFGDKRKALGFVLAIEGVMLVSHGVTSVVALVVLIAINALANGSSIALAREATCKRREAAARATATRASKRGHTAAKAKTRTPIEVVELPKTIALVAPRCRREEDVIDAEIVSEERYAS
jgi:hypothetical protein